MVQDEFLIHEPLKVFLNRLSVAFGVKFSESEMVRVFTDEENDQRSKKIYLFHSSNELSVSGIVDEYEPEVIRIEVTGRPSFENIFQNLIDEIRYSIGSKRPIP